MAIQAAGTPAHPKRQTGGYGVDGGERIVELSGGSARPGMGVGFWPEPDEMRQIVSFGMTGQAGDLGVYVCNSHGGGDWRASDTAAS